MIDKPTFAILRLVHGSFNIMVVIGFLYQGFLGLGIRKKRTAGTPDQKRIRRHRKMGPYLVVLGVMGFLAGKTLVYLEHKHFLEYPLHYTVGAIIAILLIITLIISKKIRGSASGWRTLHFSIVMVIIALYLIQVILGLGILL
ncbi:MAG: DUF4079 family protein [Nitrospiraceae bacterium]|nr:MAG: DUF4079 family protein [Nitrospiraceae bacterium]